MGILPGFNSWAYQSHSGNAASIPVSHSAPIRDNHHSRVMVNPGLHHRVQLNSNVTEPLNAPPIYHQARKWTLPVNSNSNSNSNTTLKMNSSGDVMPDAFGLGFTQYNESPSSMHSIPGIPIIYPRKDTIYDSCNNPTSLSETFLGSPFNMNAGQSKKQHDPASLLLKSSLTMTRDSLIKRGNYYNGYTNPYPSTSNDDSSHYSHSGQSRDSNTSSNTSLAELSCLYGLVSNNTSNPTQSSLNIPYQDDYTSKEMIHNRERSLSVGIMSSMNSIGLLESQKHSNDLF